MQTLTQKNKTYSYPSTMEEFTAEQLEKVLEILTEPNSNIFKQKLKILELILPIRKILAPYHTAPLSFLTELYLAFPEYILKFLKTTEHNNQLHRISLTINFIFEKPFYSSDKIKFQYLGKTYQGPGDSFQYLTFDEYANLDAVFFDQEDDMMDRLTAILFRETIQTTQPDKRTPFHSQEIETRTKQFKELPFKYKLNAFYYYTACRQALIYNYPEVFAKPKEESESPAPASAFDWNDLIFSISKQGTWKSLAELMSENIWTVMEYLKYLNKPKDQNQ